MTDPIRSIPRRTLLTGAGALSLGAIGAFAPGALAQRTAPASDEIPLEDLLKPGALPDLVLGKADAACTIVEYASMTCPHCASFHTKVFPTLKEKYVDTGKVRFIFREFPFDNLATAASMLMPSGR